MKDKTKEKIEDIIIIVVYMCLIAFVLVMLVVATKVLYIPKIKESCMMQVNNGHYEKIDECIKYELKYNTYYYNY